MSKNVTVLKLNKYIVLFSYQTPVAYQDRETKKYFFTDKWHSRTTSKHISQWLKDNNAYDDAVEMQQAKLDHVFKFMRVEK